MLRTVLALGGRSLGVTAASTRGGRSGYVVELLFGTFEIEHIVQGLVFDVVRRIAVDEGRFGIVIGPGEERGLGFRSGRARFRLHLTIVVVARVEQLFEIVYVRLVVGVGGEVGFVSDFVVAQVL